MPRHADEQTAVVAEVRGPELLRVCHERIEILLETPVVESLEGSSIVKILALGVGGFSVLAEDIQLQGVWPPVSVARDMLVYDGYHRGGRERGDKKQEVIPSATSSNIAFLVCNRTFTHDVD